MDRSQPQALRIHIWEAKGYRISQCSAAGMADCAVSAVVLPSSTAEAKPSNG
jgi:hypothetical protein